MKILAIYLGFYSLILILAYFLSKGLFMALSMVLAVFLTVLVVAFVMFAPLVIYQTYQEHKQMKSW
jgi:hypothetical protein